MFHSHFDSAKKILTAYQGGEPFHLFLKNYFRNNKKHGSKDRKSIASLCYNYFRLGFAEKDLHIDERVAVAQSVAEQFSDNRKVNIVNAVIKKDDVETLKAVDISKDIFPFTKELSAGIDAEELNKSFLQQPNFFLRIRPGFEKTVTDKLNVANVEYTRINDQCLAFDNAVKLDGILLIDKEVQIQDFNSQQTGAFLKSAAAKNALGKVWDCCAASGGKSIMAVDMLGQIQLTVSDKRNSILENLKNRFEVASIKNYTSFVCDIANKYLPDLEQKFQLVIADLPCTGSGTWSRTPEQLYYFKREKIREYNLLQRSIIDHIIPTIADGGYLLYITCSLFQKENEDVVDYIKEKFHFRVLKMELLKGYSSKADTMFAALLINDSSD